MLAKENEYLQEAAESLYVANADEIVRQQCIAREDAERRERTLEKLAEQHRIEAEQHRIAREEAEQREAALFKEMEQLKEMLTTLKQKIEK